MKAGMPVSPHQTAVLTPRQKVIDEQIATSGGRMPIAKARIAPAGAIENPAF
jgi:hypothetical protein